MPLGPLHRNGQHHSIALVLQADACLSGEAQLTPAAIQTLRCSVARAGLDAQADRLQHHFAAKRADAADALASAAHHGAHTDYIEARNSARRFHEDLDTELRVRMPRLCECGAVLAMMCVQHCEHVVAPRLQAAAACALVCRRPLVS